MVLQEPGYLTHIRENIRYGDFNATDDMVVGPRMANVDHFVRTLPHVMIWS